MLIYDFTENVFPESTTAFVREGSVSSLNRQCSTIRVYVKTHTHESNISVKETPAMWCSYFSACYLSNSLPPSTSTSIARTLPPTSLLMAKILASSSFQRIKPLLSTIKISPSYNYTAFSTEWKLDEIFVNIQHRSSHHLLFIQILNLKR